MADCQKPCKRTEQLRERYRFLREDFRSLETKALHSDLIFDFTPERVHVTNTSTFHHDHDTPLTTFVLDANNLTIESVAFLSGEEFPSKNLDLASNDWLSHVEHIRAKTSWIDCVFDYNKDGRKLSITLPKQIQKGEQFIVKMETKCYPNASMLEGLYLDYTPKGCPQTVISQCQQYGFQRITPSIDQMLNKQTYTTTIIADGAFTNLITNGDLHPAFTETNERGLPRPKYQQENIPTRSDVPEDLAKKRVMIRYENVNVPMATYLFFLGTGTYLTYSRSVEYPDGDSFEIELLLFPDLVPVSAAVAKLDIIADSILWTHISLGPEVMEHQETREKLYALLRERESIVKQLEPVYFVSMSPASKNIDSLYLKNALQNVPTTADLNPSILTTNDTKRQELQARLKEIRSLTKQLIQEWKMPGYKYTGQIYREISMENSQYGGMENVGNTTIVSSVIAVTPNTTDREAVYIEGVTIHEFFHNQNGSEVTGASPFEIWLNEAVTVWFERRKVAERFGEDFRRLEIVRYAFTPGAGPLAVDSSPNSMAIEPEGFNSTTELVSAMTYSKAPEFVNMIMLMIGEDKFHRALDYYYKTYAHGNATTKEWLGAMERVSGLSLQQMAKGWLSRSNHPTLHYSMKYDEAKQQVRIALHQTGYQDKPAEDNYPWIFPVKYALVHNGEDIHEGLFIMDKERDEIVVDNISKKPDFASIARYWSFFGKTHNEDADIEQVTTQALSDKDVINRRFAFMSLADKEKVKAITALETVSSKLQNLTHNETLESLYNCQENDAKELKNINTVVSQHGIEGHRISPSFIKLYGTILFHPELDNGTKASILQLGGSTTNSSIISLYQQTSDAVIGIEQAICYNYAKQLIELYNQLDSDEYYTGELQKSMHVRSLKFVILRALSCGYKYSPVFQRPEMPLPHFDFVHAAKRMLFKSSFMTDKIAGLNLLLSLPDGVSSQSLHSLTDYKSTVSLVVAPLITTEEKVQLLAKAKKMFASHPDSWSTYISVVSSVDSDEVFQNVDELLNSPEFKIELAGHARTLCRGWVVHRNRTLLTQEGLAKTIELAVKVGKVNEMSAFALLQAFSDLKSFHGTTKEALVQGLQDLQSKLDPKEQQSLHNNISRMLDAVKN